MPFDYDLVVLGSGPAGEWGAVTAARLGKRVLVVDKGAEPGGAAVHTGTLPSKTLRETALFLSGREQREVYGVGVTIDEALFVPKLLSRKAVVKRLEVDRIKKRYKDHGVELVRARATVTGPNAVKLERAADDAAFTPRDVTTEYILVATGSVPHRPPELPWDDKDVEDSDSILELDMMPSRLVVIGAGVIGCEYAAIFAALGCKVTLVDKRNELLAFLDRDMSEALRLAFVQMGIELRLEDVTGKIRREEGGPLLVDLQRGGAVTCDKLLFCGGRSGATDGLGLEAIGVKLGLRGSVVVDDRYATNIPSVLAAGDVIGFPALASTSMEQGRIAATYAFEKNASHLPDPAKKTLPYGIYTIPEVSCVGMSEEDAIAAGKEVIVGKGTFDENARAKINGFSQGFVKLVFDKSTRACIGAHAIGDRATELIHIGQACVALGGTVDAMSNMVFNYPTLSECFQFAARDALSRWT